MAKSLGICEGSIGNIVKMDLKMKSYKHSHGQELTEAQKVSRLQKAKKMLRLVAAGRHRQILFTDEKIFTMYGKTAALNMWDKDTWPSNSCDLNAMDYSGWAILEKNLVLQINRVSESCIGESLG
uniref:Transposase n=1 Tax=Acrobeloides nanus TaxID=290746 RepID=A0A914D5E3_9BILA